jgi:FMN phosphatase YigB (HAD superfamily)
MQPALSGALARLFEEDVHIANRWMLGEITFMDVIEKMDLPPIEAMSNDHLGELLIQDCMQMRVNVELMEVLVEHQHSVRLVIATDNMDCFSRAFRALQLAGPEHTDAHDSLRRWIDTWHGMISSSDVGTLKGLDPKHFYSATLDSFGLDFSNALLIDDREDNCDAFRSVGGTAIRWHMDDGIGLLRAQLGSWGKRVHEGLRSV